MAMKARVDGTFQNRLLGQTGIFQNVFSAIPEPFGMEYFRKYFQQNWNLTKINKFKTVIFQNGIYQMESFRNVFFFAKWSL
jgi:hypothetical protein